MRLEITRKANLAMQVMAALQQEGGRVSGKALASQVETSTTYLAQVMAPLVRNNWVLSQPGRAGGYELLVDPAQISVLDVIETVEGATDTQSCVMRSGDCSAADPCATHEAWSRARNALLDELAATPLSILSPQGAVQ